MNLYFITAWNGKRYEDYDSLTVIVVAETEEQARVVAADKVGLGQTWCPEWCDWKLQLIVENVTGKGIPETPAILAKNPCY